MEYNNDMYILPSTPSCLEYFSMLSSSLSTIALNSKLNDCLFCGISESYNPWSNNTNSAFLSLPFLTNTETLHVSKIDNKNETVL